MTISVTEKISDRVRQYLSGEDQKFKGFESEVRELNALPIYLDFLTDYFLRPDGELFARHLVSEGTKPEIVKNRQTKIIVINLASEWFPELKELLPARPGDACDCPYCVGKGQLKIADSLERRVSITCSICVSLGWVQNSSA